MSIGAAEGVHNWSGEPESAKSIAARKSYRPFCIFGQISFSKASQTPLENPMVRKSSKLKAESSFLYQNRSIPIK